jgi:hypothetical protein
VRDRDDIVAALLEDLDEVRSDPAGGSGDGDLLAPGFRSASFFLSQRRRAPHRQN